MTSGIVVVQLIKSNTFTNVHTHRPFRLDDAKKYRNQDRDTIARLNQQVSDLEAEVNLLRRTVDSLETDRNRDRDRIKSLEAEVDRLRLVSQARGPTNGPNSTGLGHLVIINRAHVQSY